MGEARGVLGVPAGQLGGSLSEASPGLVDRLPDGVHDVHSN